MVRKIRGAGAVVIAIIIIVALIFMSVYQGKNVGDVDSLQIQSQSENAISFEWSKASSADGYCIYQSTDNGANYEKIATVNDSKVLTYTAENLEQGKGYTYKVTAFKNFRNKTYESEKFATASSYSLPSAPSELSLDSTEAGKLVAKWTQNENAVGYELQYAKDGDFDNSQTVKIEDNKTVEKEIDSLEEKADYSVRVCSYIQQESNAVDGAWSEEKNITIAETIEMPSDIDPDKPMIALTFDDGPGYNSASDEILDVLEKYNARATFFMVGTNAADHPDNLKRKISLGCELGNHTYKHDKYGKNVQASDIKKASDAIYKACGQYPTAFRSTGGNTTDTIINECKSEGMPLYYWSIDTEDWKSRDAQKVYNAVIKNAKDGDIVLMHDIYSSTAEAVEKIVPKLIEEGYQLVTVSELIQVKTGNPPTAGQQYVDATTINNNTN